MPRVWLIIKGWRRPPGQGQDGFSIVEVLLAAAVFAALTTGLIGAIVYGRASTASAGDSARAYILAEEGLDASRNISNAAYANLTIGSHGLLQSGGLWTFSGTSDVDPSGVYTRVVTVASAGTNRMAVTSTVTWNKPGGTGTVTLTARIVNWASALKSWTTALLAGSFASGTTAGYRVYTTSNYAYLVRNTNATTNFFIVNISNPAAAALTGSLTLANTPTNIFVSGNYAYVSNSSTAGELQIVDISVPATPVLKATFNAPGAAGGGLSVFVSGNYAYLGRAANSTNGELTIVDVTNPLAPVQKGIYSNNLAMNKVIVVPGATAYAYIATNNTASELLIVNVTNPAAPVLTKAFNTTTTVAATSVAINNNTAFMVAGTNLISIDVTTRAAPTQTSTFTLGTTAANDIALDITGNFLFLASADTAGEVQTFNVSNPASMTWLKNVDIAGTPSAANSISYNSSLDIAVAASSSTTQQLVTVTRN